jgi:hypothetical protein
MDELNVIKQVIQVAFASGKLTNLEEIKVILIAFEKIESKLKGLETKNNVLDIVPETTTRP